jgi:uncharacterized protein (DUF608 family)
MNESCGDQPEGCGDACKLPGSETAARELGRRQFLKLAGAGTASLVALPPGTAVMAGPFFQPGTSIAIRQHLVPADKQLDAEWVRSLSTRGAPSIYRGDELRYIGMPVGGICAGNVYLGGDGRLWLWDIFNQHHQGCVPRERVEYRGAKLRESDGANYVQPPEQQAPFDLSFHVALGDSVRPLDRTGWRDVSFLGQYPVGNVDYRDADSPVSVKLEAFSPFIRLNTDDSSLPATVLRYTLTNDSAHRVEVTLGGRIENPVLLYSSARMPFTARRNTIRKQQRFTAVECTAYSTVEAVQQPRPDIVFERFEKPTYEGWTATGSAFDDGPIRTADMPDYQDDVNGQGERVVNTHNVRRGEDVRGGDQHTGTLTSREFTIERRYINFRIGGGNHPGQTCLNLLVNGQVVRTATGHDANRMRLDFFDVRDLEGKQAQLQIVDQATGGWGNIGVDDIIFADTPRTDRKLEDLPDFGSICLAAIGAADAETESAAPDDAPIGQLSRKLALDPGESQCVSFLVAWYFPNLAIPGLPDVRRWYSSKFKNALDVVGYVAQHLDRLTAETFKWRDTWYDSSLPHWFLDRTFANTSILATNTCHRFADGRFWCWEGIGCCHGTCTHVWGYAQAVARIFPELERYLRDQIDFGRFFHEDTGAIDYRAEFGRHVAHDGQAGSILSAYREHQMSPDDRFLRRRWPRIRKALELLMREDGNDDGLLEGAQYNTLDASWYGPMGWLSSLYLAAVRAGEAMATETHDSEFAQRCRTILDRGRRNMVERLFNGEYFIHIPDPAHPEANGTNDGCHIDQVYGQSWAHQVGLGRIIPEGQTKSALQSLWKYNFAPDVGVYRDGMKIIKGGRWYAVPGDAGLIMCTFPKGGAERATGRGRSAWAAMYFNECMTGFEYQAAGHMIWEGLLTEGLAVTRAIHDRYHPSRRNPYNEIECSDHYARAMAGYGVFLAACGFQHHGPKGHLGFAPRLTPENFRAAFTTAEGWGTFSQQRDQGTQRATIMVSWGRLRLRTLALDLPAAKTPQSVRITAAGRPRDATFEMTGVRLRILPAEELLIEATETAEVTIVT